MSIKKENKSYQSVPKKLRIALDTKIPKRLGSSDCITIYVFGDDNYKSLGFNKFDVFVDSPIKDTSIDKTDASTKKIPRTTKREIFRHTLETKGDIYVNGATLIGLHPDTLHDMDMMKKALGNLISQSLNMNSFQLEGLIYHRRVNSVINQTSEHAGIWVTTEIYSSLVVGGEIYVDLYRKYGVNLKLIRDFKASTSIDIVELVKLQEISW